MKKLNTPIRIFVGLLFIFSGLIKANDPHGLSYKMQEFFEVWGFDFLNPLSLFSSLGMNVLEVFAGIAIIVNWQTKKITWLLFMLILFFTFLTGYALFSGKIKTCGCFGDCLPLTPAMSFTKDIILGVLIVILLATNSGKANKGIFGKIVLYTVTLGTAAFQWYVLSYLPIVDCLPFKKGNDIVEQMKVPVGAVPDSTSIEFIYTKNNKEVRFDQANFPIDFDSTYVYVDRKDKVVRKGKLKIEELLRQATSITLLIDLWDSKQMIDFMGTCAALIFPDMSRKLIVIGIERMLGDGHHNAENIGLTLEKIVNQYSFNKNKI